MQVAKPTIQQISEITGYSVSTVSRVLNGYSKQYRISEKAQELIKKKAEELNFKPNQMARGLRLKRTFTIGLVIPDIANPFFAMMAKHIEKAASLSDYSILLVDSDENTEKEKQQIKNMIARDMDGIIVAPVGSEKKHFTEIIERKIPLVFVDRYFENCEIPFVTSDNLQGGYEATKHLIENGHKRIGLIKGDTSTQPVLERLNGYRKALQEYGITLNSAYEIGDTFSIESGYQSVRTVLKLPQPPTALFAMSNLIGLGAIKAIKETDLNIPTDISLIVYDDQPYAAFLNPSITTVKQDSEQIGKLAVNYIFKKINNEKTDVLQVKLQTQIISRASVKKIK
ncbi:MAG: LacI family DNA-binding transcriptional regulator [Prolixibacteraceae bacterium]|nr:LacI family DNA-binding transcriptional regulator [Prolixibacteraceae bacterium]